MENHIIMINSIHHITRDVLRIATDKPAGFTFLPGQVTHIAINKTDWLDAERPFTFMSLPTDDFL